VVRKKTKIRSSKNRIVKFAFGLAGTLAIVLTLLPWYSSHLENDALREAEQGHQVESLHQAETAVKYNPYSIQALFVLAGSQQRLGREAQARNTLMKAAELQPMNYMVWEQLAIYERDKWGQPELAQEHFEKAISLNPQDRFLKKTAGISADKTS